MTWHADRWIDDRPQLLGMAVEPIRIEAVPQADGSTMYAVRQAGACLSRDGRWWAEPTPSERTRWLPHGTQAFRAACRFPTWEAAALEADRQPPAGRFHAGILTSLWPMD